MQPSHAKHSRGLTLIEVLVAVLVLSIGLLGMGALISVGIKNNQSAYFRTQATVLAYDILDRMRANRNAAQAGGYNVAVGAGAAGAGQANTDLTEWKNALALLPGGDGGIACNAVGTCTVTVQWDDSLGVNSDPVAAQTHQVVVNSRL